MVAQAESPGKKIVSDLLHQAGHQVLFESNSIDQTLWQVRSSYCDLVIIDSALEGSKALKTAGIIDEERLAAVLLLADTDKLPGVRRFHYLIRPVSYNNLIPAVEASLLYWRRELAFREQIRKLEDKLETRKLQEKAKGLLIEKLGLNEAKAHRVIQQEAMNRGITLKEMAIKIIDKPFERGGK